MYILPIKHGRSKARCGWAELYLKKNKNTKITRGDYGGVDSPCLSVITPIFCVPPQLPNLPHSAASGKWTFEVTGAGTAAGTGRTTPNARNSKRYWWLLVVNGGYWCPTSSGRTGTSLLRIAVHTYKQNTVSKTLIQLEFLLLLLLRLGTKEAKMVSGKQCSFLYDLEALLGFSGWFS